MEDYPDEWHLPNEEMDRETHDMIREMVRDGYAEAHIDGNGDWIFKLTPSGVQALDKGIARLHWNGF